MQFSMIFSIAILFIARLTGLWDALLAGDTNSILDQHYKKKKNFILVAKTEDWHMTVDPEELSSKVYKRYKR